MKHLVRLILHLIFQFIISNSHFSSLAVALGRRKTEKKHFVFMEYHLETFPFIINWKYQLMQLSKKCDNNIATYAASGHKHFIFIFSDFERAMNSDRPKQKSKLLFIFFVFFSISNTWMIPNCDSGEMLLINPRKGIE